MRWSLFLKDCPPGPPCPQQMFFQENLWGGLPPCHPVLLTPSYMTPSEGLRPCRHFTSALLQASPLTHVGCPLQCGPGFGTIPSGGMQVITADCVADPVGRCEEFIAIDISDRDPRDQPVGIPYSLLAEACQPGTERSDGAASLKIFSFSITDPPSRHSIDIARAPSFGTRTSCGVFSHIFSLRLRQPHLEEDVQL